MPNEHDDMKEKVTKYAAAYGLDLLAWWVCDGNVCITMGESASPRAMFTKYFTLKRFNALLKKIAK